MSSYKQYQCFESARLAVPSVYRAKTLEDAVLNLANERERLLSRIIELEAIAPFKVRRPSGLVLVWQCPEELIPFKPDVLFSK